MDDERRKATDRIEVKLDSLSEKVTTLDNLKYDFIDFRATTSHEVSSITDKVLEASRDIRLLVGEISEIKIKMAKMTVITSFVTLVITACLMWIVKELLGST